MKFWYCLFDAHEFVFVTLEIIFEMKLHNASELNISSIFDRKKSSSRSRIAGSRLFRTVIHVRLLYPPCKLYMELHGCHLKVQNGEKNLWEFECYLLLEPRS